MIERAAEGEEPTGAPVQKQGAPVSPGAPVSAPVGSQPVLLRTGSRPPGARLASRYRQICSLPSFTSSRPSASTVALGRKKAAAKSERFSVGAQLTPPMPMVTMPAISYER